MYKARLSCKLNHPPSHQPSVCLYTALLFVCVTAPFEVSSSLWEVDCLCVLLDEGFYKVVLFKGPWRWPAFFRRAGTEVEAACSSLTDRRGREPPEVLVPQEYPLFQARRLLLSRHRCRACRCQVCQLVLFHKSCHVDSDLQKILWYLITWTGSLGFVPWGPGSPGIPGTPIPLSPLSPFCPASPIDT